MADTRFSIVFIGERIVVPVTDGKLGTQRLCSNDFLLDGEEITPITESGDIGRPCELGGGDAGGAGGGGNSVGDSHRVSAAVNEDD